MTEIQWSATPLPLALKYTWAISRNSSEEKTNLLILAKSQGISGMGESAPNIRYGESTEKLCKEFKGILTELPGHELSLHDWNALLHGFPIHNALRMGLDAAYHDWLSHSKKQSVTELLNLTPIKSSPTAYTIPVMDPAAMAVFYKEYKLSRFKTLKIKINPETGLDALKEARRFSNTALMIDPNEAFEDVEVLIRFIEKIAHPQFLFLEQPMPAHLKDESVHLKKHSIVPLMADESCTDSPDWGYLIQAFDGINMKLMKAGSYAKGLGILQTARKHELMTMIGCMVESSLGIRQSLYLSGGVQHLDLDSFLYLKKNPFGLLGEIAGNILPIA